MTPFSGKTLMITGGTGSFGEAVLKRFLDTDIAEIRIFSRDEKKQDDMRHHYQNDKADGHPVHLPFFHAALLSPPETPQGQVPNSAGRSGRRPNFHSMASAMRRQACPSP